jgi:hypothetical protein
MDKFLKNLRVTSIGLGVIAASSLVYNLILFAYLYPKVLHFEILDGQMEILGLLSGLSLVLIGIFHLVTVITLLAQIIFQRSAGILKILTIVIGIISGLLLLSDLSMLQDISKQYVQGWNSASEWTILFINHGLHVLFTILAFVTLATRIGRENHPEESAVKDDVLFIATHTTGLLCGMIGLIAILVALVTRLRLSIFEILSVTIGVLVLLPYLFALSVWLFMKRKEKITDWLDEKQFLDISRASLLTILITLPIMTLISVLQRIIGFGNVLDFIWFPLFIFLTMVSFSSVTLYLSRR